MEIVIVSVSEEKTKSPMINIMFACGFSDDPPP